MSRAVPATPSRHVREGSWQTGDPLYSHPNNDANNRDTQYVREMFQVLDEDNLAINQYVRRVRTGLYPFTMYCATCAVSWSPASTEDFWDDEWEMWHRRNVGPPLGCFPGDYRCWMCGGWPDEIDAELGVQYFIREAA